MLDLVRVAAYEPLELLPVLNAAVNAAEPELDARYSPGTIRRLGGEVTDEMHDYVMRLIMRDRQDLVEGNQRATYALEPREPRDDRLSVVGLGTITPDLTPSVYRLPLQPGVMKHLPHALRPERPLGQANVTSWTLPEYYPSLGGVYRVLSHEAHSSVWTVEPKRANCVVHTAIAEAMTEVGRPQRYHVGEVGDVVVPVSRAYVKAA
jgi:hypothetical protein